MRSLYEVRVTYTIANFRNGYEIFYVTMKREAKSLGIDAFTFKSRRSMTCFVVSPGFLPILSGWLLPYGMGDLEIITTYYNFLRLIFVGQPAYIRTLRQVGTGSLA